ncbi:MAG: riboflavin biosynthesis protein RibF [Paludibacteraceae bacterium]|nr:riboflavin biosynthesis protein RibF [Paludibacteraceae bacterium]
MAYTATIGFFDGVHRGHQFLIEQLKREAGLRGTKSAVITFAEHPENTLRGTHKPLLTTLEERTELLRQTGITQIFCFQFPFVKDMTAEEFMRVLHERCEVDTLLMGYDHRFGCDRLTSFADYEQAAQRAGLQLLPIPQAPEGDISSSKIRKALQSGDIDRATYMLGKPYTLCGTVVHGRGIGHEIGFPTANIEVPADKLLPRAGVYKVIVEIAGEGEINIKDGGEEWKAILNIGTNPTISKGNQTTIEVHIPHYEKDMYGQTLTIRFLQYLREEKRFDSLDALKAQISNDILTIEQA